MTRISDQIHCGGRQSFERDISLSRQQLVGIVTALASVNPSLPRGRFIRTLTRESPISTTTAHFLVWISFGRVRSAGH